MKKILVVLPFLIVACSNDTPPTELAAGPLDNKVESGKIIGGEPTTGDSSVVALYAHVPGAEQGSLCTSTVVSPTVILTAAHCVHPKLVGEGAEFFIFTGYDLNNDRGDTLAVAETHFDPQFSDTNLTNGHDIAVVILAQPTTLKPIKVNRAPLTAAMDGQPARLVGYGLNQTFPSQEGAGLKRTANVQLNTHDDKFVQTGGWTANICSGDSGGPVLMQIDGEEQVVGVNSFGFLLCLGYGTSTRVDAYPEFLDTYVK